MRLTAPVVMLAVLVVRLPAVAHVAPSERDNNRYILLAPLGDRVRLAYTFFLGQEPGRQARARMDRNRDGLLSDREANEYGRELAAESAPHLWLSVDGVVVPVEWQEVDVGLGEPATAAGAFAVDLVAWICLEQPRHRLAHRVELRDRFHLPNPGESELRVEESPGVRVTRSQLGEPGADRTPPRLEYRWMGGPGPAESDGYRLEFDVDPALATFVGGPCAGAGGAMSGDGRSWPIGSAGAAAAALAILGALALRRRRRARPAPIQKMKG